MIRTLMPLVISDFNVRFFLGGVALAEQDFDIVSGGGEGVLEAGFVLDPARLIFGRQNDANS